MSSKHSNKSGSFRDLSMEVSRGSSKSVYGHGENQEPPEKRRNINELNRGRTMDVCNTNPVEPFNYDRNDFRRSNPNSREPSPAGSDETICVNPRSQAERRRPLEREDYAASGKQRFQNDEDIVSFISTGKRKRHDSGDSGETVIISKVDKHKRISAAERAIQLIPGEKKLEWLKGIKEKIQGKKMMLKAEAENQNNSSSSSSCTKGGEAASAEIARVSQNVEQENVPNTSSSDAAIGQSDSSNGNRGPGGINTWRRDMRQLSTDTVHNETALFQSTLLDAGTSNHASVLDSSPKAPEETRENQELVQSMDEYADQEVFLSNKSQNSTDTLRVEEGEKSKKDVNPVVYNSDTSCSKRNRSLEAHDGIGKSKDGIPFIEQCLPVQNEQSLNSQLIEFQNKEVNNDSSLNSQDKENRNPTEAVRSGTSCVDAISEATSVESTVGLNSFASTCETFAQEDLSKSAVKTTTTISKQPRSVMVNVTVEDDGLKRIVSAEEDTADCSLVTRANPKKTFNQSKRNEFVETTCESSTIVSDPSKVTNIRTINEAGPEKRNGADEGSSPADDRIKNSEKAFPGSAKSELLPACEPTNPQNKPQLNRALENQGRQAEPVSHRKSRLPLAVDALKLIGRKHSSEISKRTSSVTEKSVVDQNVPHQAKIFETRSGEYLAAPNVYKSNTPEIAFEKTAASHNMQPVSSNKSSTVSFSDALGAPEGYTISILNSVVETSCHDVVVNNQQGCSANSTAASSAKKISRARLPDMPSLAFSLDKSQEALQPVQHGSNSAADNGRSLCSANLTEKIRSSMDRSSSAEKETSDYFLSQISNANISEQRIGNTVPTSKFSKSFTPGLKVRPMNSGARTMRLSSSLANVDILQQDLVSRGVAVALGVSELSLAPSACPVGVDEPVLEPSRRDTTSVVQGCVDAAAIVEKESQVSLPEAIQLCIPTANESKAIQCEIWKEDKICKGCMSSSCQTLKNSDTYDCHAESFCIPQDEVASLTKLKSHHLAWMKKLIVSLKDYCEKLESENDPNNDVKTIKNGAVFVQSLKNAMDCCLGAYETALVVPPETLPPSTDLSYNKILTVEKMADFFLLLLKLNATKENEKTAILLKQYKYRIARLLNYNCKKNPGEVTGSLSNMLNLAKKTKYQICNWSLERISAAWDDIVEFKGDIRPNAISYDCNNYPYMLNVINKFFNDSKLASETVATSVRSSNSTPQPPAYESISPTTSASPQLHIDLSSGQSSPDLGILSAAIPFTASNNGRTSHYSITTPPANVQSGQFAQLNAVPQAAPRVSPSQITGFPQATIHRSLPQPTLPLLNGSASTGLQSASSMSGSSLTLSPCSAGAPNVAVTHSNEKCSPIERQANFAMPTPNYQQLIHRGRLPTPNTQAVHNLPPGYVAHRIPGSNPVPTTPQMNYQNNASLGYQQMCLTTQQASQPMQHQQVQHQPMQHQQGQHQQGQNQQGQHQQGQHQQGQHQQGQHQQVQYQQYFSSQTAAQMPSQQAYAVSQQSHPGQHQNFPNHQGQTSTTSQHSQGNEHLKRMLMQRSQSQSPRLPYQATYQQAQNSRDFASQNITSNYNPALQQQLQAGSMSFSEVYQLPHSFNSNN